MSGKIFGISVLLTSFLLSMQLLAVFDTCKVLSHREAVTINSGLSDSGSRASLTGCNNPRRLNGR